MNKSYLLKLSFLNQKNRAKRNKFATYNYSLIAIASIPIFLIGLFNWAIDPQDIFKTPNYGNLNHEKINKDNNDRLYKAIDIIRLRPDTIIMGSSRTKQGIDPEAAALADSPDVYNLALNGPNFYEVKRYIEHAIYNQPNIEEIILGVDFFMFNEDLANQPTFNEARLEKKRIILDDLIKNLFSIDTVNNSLDTIRASQKSSNTINDNYGDDGFMPNRNYDNGEAIWRFHQSIKLYFSLHSNYQFSQDYWNDFREIVQLCRENNIELTVFISPSHATQWESIYATERWDVFEQWKEELVKIVPVWDFSGYNSITTEEIAKYMENYVDNSHYTPEIGDLILQRILNKPNKVPGDFGVLLTSENIEQHLEKIYSDRRKWLEENPEEAKMVKDFYLEVNQRQNKR